MGRRIAFVLASLALTASAPGVRGQQPATSRLPDDSVVLGILKERVAVGRNPGIVVGLVDGAGRRVVAWGTSGRDRLPLDGRTIFEIGSITKVFTSTLLVDAVARGEVTLDEPVAKLLPATVTVPSLNGRQITLADLASHVSGLPRIPSNLNPADGSNPYADYTVEQMYAFLSGYALPRAPGERYEYSNLGAGLLGHALALRAGMPYERLVRERILGPLGMAETAIALDEPLLARMAQGHLTNGRPARAWDLATLAGAGALRSTTVDMLKFVAAELAPPSKGLPAAFATMRRARVTASPSMTVGLGYHIDSRFGHPIVWHNGGTGGFRSFMGYDTAAAVGVVVWTNSGEGVDDIGLHLLDPRYPLAKPEPRIAHREIAVDTAVFPRYVGVYDLTPSLSLTVSAEGGRLWMLPTGQQKFQLHPESESAFFLAEVEATVRFVKDTAGQVTGLVLHQNGVDLPGKRRAP